MMKRFFQENIIPYQLVVLIIFLVGITITETMTVTLSVYIVLCMFPFLSKFNILKDSFSFIFIITSLFYLTYGVLCQNTVEAVSAFCGRLLQFIALLVFFRVAVKDIEIDIRLILKCAIVFESLLGIYMFSQGIAADTTNAVYRLVAGHQPVGGNFSVVILPLIILGYFHDRAQQKFIVLSSFALLFWITLSGTRGYILIWLLSMLPIYLDYFKSTQIYKKTIVISLFLIVAIGYVGISDGSMLDFVYKLLRLGGGTGIRDSENSVALDTFSNTTCLNQLFGMGLGGTAADVLGYADAVDKYMKTTWSHDLYMSRVGASFHNLYSNILLLQGFVGCILIFGMFLWGWMKIAQSYVSCRKERLCLFMFWVGFFLMNYFRWSCDCGISEMAMLGIVLTKLDKNIS